MIKQFLGHTVPVFLLEKQILFRRILQEEPWHNTNDK
jgi:hypothetical protein